MVYGHSCGYGLKLHMGGFEGHILVLEITLEPFMLAALRAHIGIDDHPRWAFELDLDLRQVGDARAIAQVIVGRVEILFLDLLEIAPAVAIGVRIIEIGLPDEFFLRCQSDHHRRNQCRCHRRRHRLHLHRRSKPIETSVLTGSTAWGGAVLWVNCYSCCSPLLKIKKAGCLSSLAQTKVRFSTRG